MSETVDEFMVFFAVIIGAFGKLLVHAFDVCLHFEDVFESQFRLLHHSTLITENHHLWQVTDSTFAGNGNDAGSGLL